jgi:hypothetical protein
VTPGPEPRRNGSIKPVRLSKAMLSAASGGNRYKRYFNIA